MTSKAAKTQAKVVVCIGICTYRRSELEDALRSVGGLSVPPGVEVLIVVADNDITSSATARVNRLRAEIPFDISYVHCPQSNISIARNACLDNSSGDFLAYLDDDETCSPEWLEELLNVAQRTGADAILGPVRAVYSDHAPCWIRTGNFHSSRPVWVDGEIRTGYTSNVLLRRASPCVHGRRFNLTLGRTGGEDTEYFTDLCDAGGRIAFAPAAWVFAPVPDFRARFSWLALRFIRAGQTHGRLLGRRARGLARMTQVALASAKAGYCFAMATFNLLSPEHRNRHALRGLIHAGAVSGLMGVREIEQYGRLESTTR